MTKIKCKVTASQLAALKRAQLWYAKNRSLPVAVRSRMIISIDTVLCFICITSGPELEPALLQAFVAVVDAPDFSQDDFLPLFALAATLDNLVMKSLVRSLGQKAMTVQ